jgi:PIN domain nuclease of toxin-antitoxin system
LTLSSKDVIEVRLLLDTAILIWALESPERLTRRATAALKNPGNVLEFSVISLSEIAIKQARGKIRLSASDTQQALKDLGIRILSYTADHAFLLFELPLHHKDPFDRQIIAQALSENIRIVTPDEKFSLYEGLKIIW